MILREEAAPGLVRAMNALWILSIGGHVAIPILMKLRKPAEPTEPRPPPAA